MGKRGRVALGVAILFGFFAGWIAVFAAAYELSMLEETRAWPSKRGVITASYANRPRGFGWRRFNNIEIAGVFPDTTKERFALRRIGYGVEHAIVTRSRAEALAKHYPATTELEVFYEASRSGFFPSSSTPPGGARLYTPGWQIHSPSFLSSRPVSSARSTRSSTPFPTRTR